MRISFTVLTTVGAFVRHLFAMVTEIVLMVQMNDTISVSCTISCMLLAFKIGIHRIDIYIARICTLAMNEDQGSGS